jgi:hypothetical protein
MAPTFAGFGGSRVSVKRWVKFAVALVGWLTANEGRGGILVQYANVPVHYQNQISSSQGSQGTRRRILSEDEPGPVAILDRGGMNHDTHRPPFAVDQRADFAACQRRNPFGCFWPPLFCRLSSLAALREVGRVDGRILTFLKGY